ncbi:hypothetical protein [Promicromonospora iranensis]|uniref:hypothetical protein n=1 Tax=Promicromonospora iranensis TaxID=1105144 RepID=UPI0023A989C1|nr:hypothetical protein [Promicromonospora iranensis]
MTASHDTSGPDSLSEPPRKTDDTLVPDSSPPAGQADEPGVTRPDQTSGRRSAAGVTVVLLLALWAAIVLVVVSIQMLLNRIFGTDLEIGALPGVWNWVLTAAAAAGTWALVSNRHPRGGSSAGRERISGRRSAVGVTVVLVLALWVAIVLVLAGVQITLDRTFGINVGVGSSPDVWNWLLRFGLVAGTWAFVRSRHPAIGP